MEAGFFNEGSFMTIASISINGNDALNGGGIYSLTFIIPSPVGSLAVLNSNIMQNTAESKGGGIYWVGASPTLSNDIFDENDPDDVYPEI
jgi:predicted outer membrane repeat protein